jgi:PAS domain S-box-containing protein
MNLRRLFRSFFYPVPREELLAHNGAERARTARELKLLRTLIDRSSDAIEVFEPQTLRFLDINEKACLDLGYSRQELLSLTVSDIDPTLDQSSVARVSEELQKSGSLIRRTIHRRKDGSTFPVEVNLRQVQLDRNYIVTVVRDTTERSEEERRIQALMRISEKLNSNLDMDALLNSLILDAMEMTGAEIGLAGLRTEQGMSCHTCWRNSQAFPFEYTWPPGVGLPGWVLVHKAPYITNDAASDPVIAPEIRETFEVRTALSTPLLDDGGNVLGFFEVNNKRGNSTFSPSDVKILLALSQLASVALRNTLAHGRTRQVEEAFRAEVAERERAEKDLRRSEASLAEAQRLAQQGRWAWNVSTGGTVLGSPELYRICGLDPEKETISDPASRPPIRPQDVPVADQVVREAIREKKKFDLYLRINVPNGSIKRIHCLGQPVLSPSGDLVEFIVTALDVTEQEMANEALRESEERFSKVFHSSPTTVVLARLADGCFLDLNEAFVHLFGYERAEALGQTAPGLNLLVNPQDGQEIRQMLRDGRLVRDYETRARARSGRILDVCLFIERIELAGEPCVLATVYDITEHKEAEQKLRKSEALLAQAEQLANVGSWELDLTTDTLVWSEQIYRMLNLNPRGASEKAERFWQMVLPDDRERARRENLKAIAQRRPMDLELRCMLPDGRVRTIQGRAVPYYDENGHPLRLAGMAQDITERREAEDGLRRLSQQLLRTRDAERRQMARELHETVGQSLAALKMTLGRLRDVLSEDDEAARELVQASVELAEDAVREVRVVSYLMHPPMLDEGGLALALRWYARGFSERSDIQAEVEVADDFGRCPQEIETTIFRIVQEALTNVHRYSGSRTVTIRLAREERQIRAEIQDQGCGLVLPAPVMGWDAPLGVGIAGMRERVKQLHGVFEIESSPGRGTTVRAVFPIAHQDASSRAAGEASRELEMAKEPQKSKGKRAGS